MKNLFTFIFSLTKKLKKLDYLLILIVFVIFSSLVFVKLTKKSEWITVGVHITNNEWWWQQDKSTSYWLARDLVVGSLAKDVFGNNVAEVIDKQIIEDNENRQTVFVVLKLKADFDKKRNVYLFNSRPVEVGKDIDVTFADQNVEGIVSFFGSDAIQTQQAEAIVKVKFEWVDKDLAAMFKEGMMMTDGNQRKVIEVLNLKDEIYSYWHFSDIRGQTIKVFDPNFRNVVADFRIKVFKNGNRYYFLDGSKMSIGSRFDLFLDDFSLMEGKIIDFKAD